MQTYLEMTHQKLLVGDPELNFGNRAFSPLPKLNKKLCDDCRETSKSPISCTIKSRGKGLQSNKTLDLSQQVKFSRNTVKVSES